MKGLATLPTIIIISAIILEIGIIIGILAYYINISVYLNRLANTALYAASSGINDAIIKVGRDRALNATYTLSLGSNISADVIIQKETPTTTKTTVFSTGKAQTTTKKLKAILNISPANFKTSLESWEEL